MYIYIYVYMYIYIYVHIYIYINIYIYMNIKSNDLAAIHCISVRSARTDTHT